MADERLYAIAVGRSRFDTEWDNREVSWGSLVNALTKKVTPTKETLAEYLRMPKEKQDRIKDIGGFVGGHTADGRRRGGSIDYRSLVTLDMDEGRPGDVGFALTMSPWRMLVYSTHKHSSAKPRVRIVIPLSRDVTAEEYEPIARKCAETLGVGMDPFDDTTYQASRLMYYPSMPRDGERVAEAKDGPDADPDQILATYADWRDSRQWPVSSREGQRILHANTKLGDPKDKPGIVGQFNRAYNVEEAMEEFLSDVYKREEDGRWTYLKGSTSHGVIIYGEGWYAHSHHGTDPAHDRSLSAFDLVRIHKYGDLDRDAPIEAKVSDLPSYKAMAEWARKDGKTKMEIAKDVKEKDARELAGMGEPTGEGDGDWKKSLHYGGNGRLLGDAWNVELVMENDPGLRDLVAFNAFRKVKEIRKKAPWDRGSEADEVWDDPDDAQLRIHLSKKYGLTNASLIKDVLDAAAQKRSFNPVKDYIESAEWDGKPRCEELFVRYLGAEDSEYVRTVTRKMLVAAVKRIYEPGCKFDYMVTLVGRQGIGKSLLVQKLGHGWASDSLPDIRGKQAYEALDGVWLMEMGELTALKKADRESIKLFISKTEDMYRKAYGRNVTPNKRTCIFIGTTNDADFLNDSTGARRFLVIDTDERKARAKVWEDLTEEEVSQIWAEAYILYRKGEDVMGMPEEVGRKAREEQDRHGFENPKRGAVEAFLGTGIPAEGWRKKTVSERMAWFRATAEFRKGEANGASLMEEGGEPSGILRERVCALEVWCECFQRDIGSMKNADAAEINAIMDSLGWKREDARNYGAEYGKQRGFRRPSETATEPETATSEGEGAGDPK